MNDNDNDRYNIQRFIDAQKGIYELALQELKNGEKRSHWMWFIFPQLKSLGRSEMSEYYGISGKEEANFKKQIFRMLSYITGFKNRQPV